MKYLFKVKSYLIAWLVFLLGQTWVIGMDSFLRLRKPPIRAYIDGTKEIFRPAKQGFSDGVFVLVICATVFLSIYLLFRSLGFFRWKSLSRKDLILRGIVFLLSLFFGFVLYSYMGLSYVLDTGIDSL
jgi:hypothetical protein